MSSKLVKQQLSSLLSGGTAKPSVKKNKNRKQRKQRQAEATAEKPVLESNLKYFKRTKGPSSQTKELLEKVLAQRGFKQAKQQEEDDLANLDLGDDLAF